MGMQVVNGALIKCTFGTAPTSLVVLPTNSTMAASNPAGNIMDNKPFVQIIPFAMCITPSNPAVAAAMGAPMPCTPVTPAPWIPTSPTTMIGKMPTLSSSSSLVCAYGGMIQITMPACFTVMPG
jgi:hypothetical protein